MKLPALAKVCVAFVTFALSHSTFANPLLSWDFAPSLVTASPTDTIIMSATLYNSPTSTESFAVTQPGFGFDSGTLVGTWSAFPNRRRPGSPYLLTTSAASVYSSFSTRTIAPGESATFSFGTLSPLDGVVAPGTYTLDKALIGFGALMSSWIESDTKFSVTVSPPPPTNDPCRSTDPLFFQHNLDLQPSGADMGASFISNLALRGCSLNDIAAAYGYDHFNWVQTIDHYDGALYNWAGFKIGSYDFPLLDPPPGGYLLQPADLKPFYWDETSLDSDFYLRNPNNMSDYTLNFHDIPKSHDIFEPGQYMSFLTSLVGVREDDTWDPLATFSWKSNYNGDTGGVFNVSRDLTPPVGGTGGIFDVALLSDPWAVPQDVQQLWRENGASIPTPSTPALLLFGIFALAFSRKRLTRPS